jgi:hypothetical protein
MCLNGPMTAKTITIARRFNGPAESGNGGYVCGLLANEIEGASQVTLRSPPPLETPLQLDRADGGVRLMHGADVVAEVTSTAFDMAPPPAPRLAQAEAARARYRGLIDHRYTTCFVCGPGRPLHDGLEIYTGPVEGGGVACSWTPTPDLADESGHIAPEFIHAALDCPSYWALPRGGEMAALLARLTSRIDGPLPRTGETLIVAAWPLASEGRKHRGGSALYRANGALIACAEALWIEPRV